MRSIYDPRGYPAGVPNPYGVRVHAWNGGPMDQGTRFHGAVYTRPMWGGESVPMPLNGLGAEDPITESEVTVAQQQANIDLELLSQCNPIPVTGKLDGKTCSVLRILDYEMPGSPSAGLWPRFRTACESVDPEYWPVYECKLWPPKKDEPKPKTEASMIGPALFGMAMLGLVAVLAQSAMKKGTP